eukprot:6687732-Heterocapsa_arctica.AAC.1
MLSALLTPVWSSSHPFLEQLLQWERACDDYRAASGIPLPDNVKCAIVARWAPDPARSFLHMSPTEYTDDYEAL